MGLTVSEKQHFRDRLDSRAQELRDQIQAEKPTWKRDLVVEAQRLIEEHFGVENMMVDLEDLREERDKLDTAIRELEGGVVEKMQGRKRADLPSADMQQSHVNRRNNYRRYHSNEDEGTFDRYPGTATNIMRDHCKRQLTALIREDPVGKKLKKLEDDVALFEDQIAGCGSHGQLQKIWSEIRGALDIFELDHDETRASRKVDTTRARQRNGK